MNNRKGRMLWAIVICFIFILSSTSLLNAASREHPRIYKSPRVMGMGGANVAIGGQFDSVFYNPAGLTKMPENNWEVNIGNLSTEVGENVVDFVEDMTDALDVTDQDGDGDEDDDQLDAVNALLEENRGKHLHFNIADLVSVAKNRGTVSYGIGGLATVNSDMVPHHGLGLDGLLEMHADIMYGGIGGLGYVVSDNLSVGVAVKFLHKESIDNFFTAREIIDNEDDLDNYFTEELKQDGDAVGFDVGVIYEFMKDSKYKPAFGVSLQNIGDLDFGDAGEIPMTANIGVSIRPEIPKLNSFVVGLDYVDLLNNYDEDSDIGKRVRFGAEVGIFDKKMASMKVRAGLYQGYFTFGADLRLFIATLSYTTYAEEVGAYAGQDEDRRHLLALNLGW